MHGTGRLRMGSHICCAVGPSIQVDPIQFVRTSNDKQRGWPFALRPGTALYSVKSPERSERQVQPSLDKFAIPSAVLAICLNLSEVLTVNDVQG